jgi:tetratricopeptide (TPR) repeat protein
VTGGNRAALPGMAMAKAMAVAALLAAGCASAGDRPADEPAATPEPAARIVMDFEDGEAGAGADAVSVEGTSLLGAPLERPDMASAQREEQEALLAAARERLAATPEDLEAWIWVGRRLGYLGRYREALAHYGEALGRFPDAPELYRHRGHRYLTVRELAAAVADLERGVELALARPDAVEPDGLPNARNQPTGTLRSNLHYHLALARYLQGDPAAAAAEWERARDAVDNPDNLVAASYWLYLARAEAGDAAGAAAALAPIRADLDVIENADYHRLLLLFRGEADPEELLADVAEERGVALATVGYGVAAWRLLRGEREAGAALLARVIRQTPWPAFGHLAAEARLARDPELRELAER